jgi:hypothetical protein
MSTTVGYHISRRVSRARIEDSEEQDSVPQGGKDSAEKLPVLFLTPESCFVGPRFVPECPPRAAHLQNRSAVVAATAAPSAGAESLRVDFDTLNWPTSIL